MAGDHGRGPEPPAGRAAIEQHGPHLPVDTDNLAVEAIRAAPGLLVLAPPVHYGDDEHDMDFPGTVTRDLLGRATGDR